MSKRRPPLLSLVLVVAAVGCHDSKVESYRVPHEPDPQLPGMTAANAPADAQTTNTGGPSAMTGNVPTEEGPSLTWTAPKDWQSQPSGPMRKASFSITRPEGKAELSVTAFPGDVGGELANVNRWRGQAGLSPLTAGALDQNVDRIDVHGLPMTVVDLGDSKSANRILGAIVPYGGGVWFFKLSGPGGVLEREKPEFLRFLHSVKAPQ